MIDEQWQKTRLINKKRYELNLNSDYAVSLIRTFTNIAMYWQTPLPLQIPPGSRAVLEGCRQMEVIESECAKSKTHAY